MLRKGIDVPTALHRVVDGFRNSFNSCSSGSSDPYVSFDFGRTHATQESADIDHLQGINKTACREKSSNSYDSNISTGSDPYVSFLNIKEPSPPKKTKKEKCRDHENINIYCKGPPKTLHTNFSELNVSWQMSAINEELQKIYPGLKHEATYGREEITRCKRKTSHRQYKEGILENTQLHPVEGASDKKAAHCLSVVHYDSGSFTYIESPIQSIKRFVCNTIRNRHLLTISNKDMDTNVCNSIKEKRIWTVTDNDMDTNVGNSIKEKQIWTVTDNDMDMTDENEFYEMRKNNMAFMKVIRMCCFIIVIAVFSAIIAYLSLNVKKWVEEKPPPTNPNLSFLKGDCTDNKVIGTLGDSICVSPKSSCSMFNTTKTLVNLTITHFPLKYFDPDEKEYTTVVIPGDKFNTDFKGWVVDYNESRIEQTLKIGKQNFTCHDIGLYRIIFHYKKDGDGICEFDIESSDPLVDLILHETDDHYHITCQMSEICTEALLSLVVKNGTASHPLQSKLNSSCTQETHTIRKEAYVLKSEMTKHTVSCKPLTDNEQLNERLAQNKYLCEGQKTLDTCKEEDNGNYYQHPEECNMFFHCGNNRLFLKSCQANLVWNPKICNCDYPHNISEDVKCNAIKTECNITLENLHACGGIKNT